MRIKVSVVGDRSARNINVQDLKFNHDFYTGSPRISFKCHKRYERVLQMNPVVFHDKHGKELFRSELARMNFRYYELDRDVRTDKVEFVVDYIQFEDLGDVSDNYLRKILERSCNSKVVKKRPPKKATAEPKGWAGSSLFLWPGRNFDAIRAKFRYAELYKRSCVFRYILRKIHRLFIIRTTESNAPT